MKVRYPTVLMLGLSAALLAACGGDNPTAVTAPPTSTVQKLDTAQVLAMAQKTSETADPLVVVGGAVVITDTSETSMPITVNAM